MRIELSMRPKLEQRLILAPQIIQSIEILQLPLLALRERVEQERVENPLIEVLDEDHMGTRAAQLRQAEEQRDEKTVENTANLGKIDTMGDEYQDYFAQSGPPGGMSSQGSGDGSDKMEAMQNTAAPSGSLQDFLLEQLHVLELRPTVREVAENIIYNLDRDARLNVSLDEIIASMDCPAAPADAEAALKIVQTFDPRGTGARDLRECLLLQLESEDPDYELQKKLVENHLLDIEHNRFPKIAKDTGADIEAVKRAIAAICSLHPAPGRLYDTEVVPYVIPDIIVELLEGEYVVSLDETNIPKLRVSRTYRQMMSDAAKGSETKEYLRKKMESARWLIDSIEQRRNTLLKVAREIVRSQHDFFEQGVSALRPLKMQEVADATSMHVATVSRAVRNKYMHTPRGIFAMRFFFTGGMNTDSGEVQTWDAVKQKIKEIIDHEDKAKPLSDDDVTAKLKEGGLDIARRTVTKYRKAMSIPSSRQRKQF